MDSYRPRRSRFFCAVGSTACSSSGSSDAGADAVAADTVVVDTPRPDAITDVTPTDGSSSDARIDVAIDIPISDASPPDGGCNACFASALSWGNQGGFTPITNTNEINPCAVYVATRMTSNAPNVSCTNEVPTCVANSTVDTGQVLRALANPVVAAALASNASYGSPTPDAPTFVIHYQGGTISVLVGSCDGHTNCAVEPQEVSDVVDLLNQVTTQQIATTPCATTFPGGF